MANFNPKDYVDVQTRILQFWNDHPDGAIRTRLMSDPSDFTTCRYVAEVYKEAANVAPDATGYAFEIAGSGMANKTSHEENCETSAIGRALANMGYATSAKDRPSREEMVKANTSPVERPNAPQKATQPPAKPTPINANGNGKAGTEAAFKRIYAILADHGLEHRHLHAYAAAMGHETSKDMTTDELKKLADGLKEKTDVAVTYLRKLADDLELKQVTADLNADLKSNAKGVK